MSRRSGGNTSSSIPSSPKGSSDPIVLGRQRVQSLGFRFSSSQPITKGDGNCMLYAIFDQLKTCNHRFSKILKLLFICSKLQSQLDENKIFWVPMYPPKIKSAGVWGADVFLQITSNVFNKNILLIPLHSSSSHMYTYISALMMEDVPFFMLYFKEWR